MQIMPCATSTDTSQQRGSSSIRTGVWAAWTQVVRDDGEDSSTAGRQAGTGEENTRGHPVRAFKINSQSKQCFIVFQYKYFLVMNIIDQILLLKKEKNRI